MIEYQTNKLHQQKKILQKEKTYL